MVIAARRLPWTLGVMRALILAWAVLICVQLAFAGGIPLQNGRYVGPVVEFKLTDSQKQVIDRYRTCQLERSNTMNVYTPYVFALTPSQAALLRGRAGFSPSQFQVYETVRHFNDAGPHWNLVLRYSEDRMEVPLKLLLPEKEASAAHDQQGWRRANPCFPALPK